LNSFVGLENADFYHSALIVKMGLEKESISGTIHLTEHACLAPIFEKNKIQPSLNLTLAGSTCPHYMLLYVAGEMSCKDWIDEWCRSVLSSCIVTNRNVSIAQKQTLSECKSLKYETSVKMEIVRFITGDKDRALPIGTLENIQNLSKNDVKKCLSEILRGDYWCCTFNRVQELWGTYHPIPYIHNENIIMAFFKGGGNKLANSQTRTVYDLSISKAQAEYIFPLPIAHSKHGYLELMFMEELLRYILDKTCSISFHISEKFFSQSEGYLSIKWNLPTSKYSYTYAMLCLKLIRNTLHMATRDSSLFAQALSEIAMAISKGIKNFNLLSTSAQWSQLMNSFIYNRPTWSQDESEEVLSFLLSIDMFAVEALKTYIDYPEKVILHCSIKESISRRNMLGEEQ